MEVTTDIDIDLKDRNELLQYLDYIPASIIRNNTIQKHPVGIYLQDIPTDPISELCSLDHEEAGSRGYVKFDMLNVHLYKNVRDEEHLIELINREPIWEMLVDPDIIKNLFHISDHYKILSITRPRSIDQLAMVLALIRPGKRHLIGKGWDEIEKEIWQPSSAGEYVFKKSHSISYALAIVVQMNLLVEELNDFS